ncbi:MAG: Hpt domain-containing protein, partial [Candidatus Competibacteraceae bacterium]|nr:Hpt domain-containing protein [Candidatus Competibacteraceae bacterium]
EQLTAVLTRWLAFKAPGAPLQAEKPGRPSPAAIPGENERFRPGHGVEPAISPAVNLPWQPVPPAASCPKDDKEPLVDAAPGPEEELPSLDRQVLEQIRSLDDDGDFLERLIQAYLQQAPKDLQQIHQALDDELGEAIRRAAHAFKSSCNNMGARKLGEICRQMEQAGAGGQIATARALAGQLDDEFQRVQRALLVETELAVGQCA